MNTDIETEVSNFVEENNIIVVNSNDDLGKATMRIKGIKAMMEQVKSSFDPIVEQAHKAHKEAIGQRDKYLKPLLDLEKKFKDAILVFNRNMAEEQRKRVKEANDRMAKDVEEKRQALLLKALQTNDIWDKDELKEKANAIVPVICDVPKNAIEQEGLSIRKTWKARVMDINLIPREYLLIEANMSALNSFARNNKNSVTMPGVEFFEEVSTAIR